MMRLLTYNRLPAINRTSQEQKSAEAWQITGSGFQCVLGTCEWMEREQE